jgi:hypothetical protein
MYHFYLIATFITISESYEQMTALEFNLAQKIQCRTKPSLVADLNYADSSTLTIVASPNPIEKVWQSIIFLCRFVSTM